jgi:hypothetical protein
VDALVLICSNDALEICGILKKRSQNISSWYRIASTPLSVDGLLQRSIPEIYSTSIEGITNVAGAWNILTVRLISTFAVQGPGFLNITGLETFSQPAASPSRLSLRKDITQILPNCSCNSDLENVPVDCFGCQVGDKGMVIWQPDGLFGNPASETAGGSWSNGKLSISLSPLALIPAGNEIIFSFIVLNPPAPVNVLCNISFQGYPGFYFAPKAIQNNALQSLGTEQAKFLYFTAQGISTVAEDINKLTVRFAVNMPLVSYDSVTVTISGLEGFQTGSGYIPLMGPSAYSVSRRAAGKWSKEKGQLVFISGAILNMP